MKEDEKENLNSGLTIDINQQDNQTNETPDDRNKTYNPPDINNIKEDKEETKEEENNKDFMEGIKIFLNDTSTVRYFLDQLKTVKEEDKEKIMNLLAELKEKRENKDEVSELERILAMNIMFNYREQLINDYKAKLNENNLNNGSNADTDDNKILDEIKKDKEGGINDNKIFVLLKYKKISSYNNGKFGKGIEDYITNYNNAQNIPDENIIFHPEIIQNEKSSHCPEVNWYDIFNAIFNCCFKLGDRNDYESLNLHISFIYYFFQNLVFIILFYSQNGEAKEIALPAIYMIIFVSGFCIYIFYKLTKYKQYDDSCISNTCVIIIFIYIVLIFKLDIYYLYYLALKEMLQNKEMNKLFFVSLIVKNVFLSYCSLYFFICDGLVNYTTLTLFGFVFLLVAGLISLFWFSLKDVGIELILGFIEIIAFHLGIYIARCKELLCNKKAWNTLVIEVFELSLILYPAMYGTFFLLGIVSFGAFFFIICKD